MTDKEKERLATVTHLPVPVADRSTIAWVREAAEALTRLIERTGLKKVDLVNKSVQVYEFIDAEMRAGNRLIVRHPDGSEQMVRIF